MYTTRRRKEKTPWQISAVVADSGQVAHKLPKGPKTAKWWLNRIFIHRGGAREFLIRYRQALRHVEVGSNKRPQLAAALLDVIADQRNLRQAFQHLYEEGCLPGPDGITWERFRLGLNQKLNKLSNQLLVGSYVRRPEWVHPIPKADGGERLLVVQSVCDRVIDRAAAQILSPALDPSFCDLSHGYRPKRSPFSALCSVRRFIRRGHTVFLAVDLRDAFGSVPLKRLLQALQERLPDERLNDLVARRLEDNPTRGLRQGSPLSPLLLNLYLDKYLDRPWTDNGHRLIRYADDLLIPCKSKKEARNHYHRLVEQLDPHGMKVKESREEAVVNLGKNCLNYLGFAIARYNDKTFIKIGDRGFAHLRERLLEATVHDRDPRRCLIGWLDYFAMAYRGENKNQVYRRVRGVFSALYLEGMMPVQKRFLQWWGRCYERYRLRQRLQRLKQKA